MANNLVPEQLAMSPICMSIMYIFFLLYFNHVANDATREAKRAEFLRSLIVFAIVLILPLFCVTAAIVMYFGKLVPSHVMVSYAQYVGIIAAALVFVQWAPQIFTTLKLSKAGSLSLPMLLLQCPGALLVVGFQLTSTQSQWTTWAPSMVSGAAQLILIVLVIYFALRDRRARKKKPHKSRGTDPDSETVSLYPNSD